MSSLNNRKVTVARTHVPIHFVGIGSITSPITKDSAKHLGALELTKVEGGLLIEAKGESLFVPDGNIVSLQLSRQSNG